MDIGKQLLRRVKQLAMISFQRQHVVGFLIDDLLGNFFLTPYSIDGHDTAFQCQ